MDTNSIIQFLYTETYSYLNLENTDLFGLEKMKVESSVRGMIDDYFRVYDLVGGAFSTQNRKQYISKYVEIGYREDYANAFTTALLKGKTKGIPFNFSPSSQSVETGKGVVSIDNKVESWGSSVIDTASSIPGTYLTYYKYLPIVTLGIGLVYLAYKTRSK